MEYQYYPYLQKSNLPKSYEIKANIPVWMYAGDGIPPKMKLRALIENGSVVYLEIDGVEKDPSSSGTLWKEGHPKDCTLYASYEARFGDVLITEL